METFLKRIIAGWFILALGSLIACPQGSVTLSSAYRQGPASPPDLASPHDRSPAPRLVVADVPAISGPASTFAKTAGQTHTAYHNKNGSDYFEGSGTASDPWIIATAADLDNVRHFVGEAHQDKHFRQTADIDLGVSPWNVGEGWVPVGNSIDPFHGHYDGDGHEVANMVIARDTIEYQGLFGRNNGTIMNLGVVNAAVTDNGSRAGILVGINDTGVIDNCYTSGMIQCDHEDGRIGGLTGWNNGTIKNSSSAASVSSAGPMAGGLTGSNSGGGLLMNCFASGNITGNEDVGGLAGRNQMEAQIVSCHATGDVIGMYEVGGLVGRSTTGTAIDSCYAMGKVSGSGWVGGLAGVAFGASVKNSFFSGTIEGVTMIGGGLVGLLTVSSSISNCYSEGEVLASGNWVGGLVGIVINNSIVSGSFSTADVSAEGFSVGGLVGSTENNSSIENANATGNVSGMDWTGGLVGWIEGSSIKNSFYSGSVEGENRVGGLAGTINNSTLSECYSEGVVFARGDFAGGLSGSAYGNSTVSGCFSKANVTGEGNYTGGLSGTLQSESSIENARFTGHVSGKDWTGGLAGWSGESVITKSYFSGSVEGEGRVGGLSGTLRNVTISACYSEGQINARGNWVGGIAGISSVNSVLSKSFSAADVHTEGYTAGGLIGNLTGNASIEDAYSSGNLYGTNWVGGLVGWADSSSITNAYSANYMYAIQANVSGGLINGSAAAKVMNAFWNTQTTGEEVSAGGEGKTNAEMISRATFTDWDFDNTWGIMEGETYPYLQWQGEPQKHNYPAGLFSLTLTTSPEGAGTLGRDGLRPEGSLILITTTANEEFVFIDWVDHQGNTFSTDSANRLIMPGHDLSLTARFHATAHSVTVTSGENGMADPEGEVIVEYDKDLVITITPDAGYRVAYILLNGNTLDLESETGWDAASGTLTLLHIRSDYVVEVAFELISFTLAFLVTDAATGAEIPDAIIRLEDNWHDAGVYLFEQMVPGTYSYLVSREGYFDKGSTAAITDDHLTEAVELVVDDTGLQGPGLNLLKVYPNPAAQEVWIAFGGQQDKQAELRIYTLQGQTVLEKSLTPASNQTLHVNLGNLRPGIYLLSLTTDEGVHGARLFIK